MELKKIEEKKHTVYFLECTFQEKEIAKGFGFSWNPEHKRWQTKDIDIATKAIIYAKPQLAKELAERIKFNQENIYLSNQSRFSGNEGMIIFPKDVTPYPYQKTGIIYALNKPNVLFADDMGLGKTLQAIGVINVEFPKKILIVCPNSLKINWRKELEKFCVHDYSINIVTSKKGVDLSCNVNIINYDILSKQEILQTQEFDVLIADEVHYAKNNKALRSKALYELKAARRIAISGTPMNKPIELYHILKWLSPKLFPNYRDFGLRYCAGFFDGRGYDFSGASNLEELQSKLRANLMVRRLKKDVLTELPNKVRQIIALEGLSDKEKAIEKKAFDSFSKDYEENAGKLSYFGAAFEELAKIRKETAIRKLPACVDFIKEIIEDTNEKVVVFAHHQDIVAELCSQLSTHNPVKVIGGMSIEDRDKAVNTFQTNEQSKVFVGSIMACAEGLTLTAASKVVFVELLFSPDKLSQAEDRCHRIGQKDTVNIYHLVLDGSVDSHMVKIIIKKQRNIEGALNQK